MWVCLSASYLPPPLHALWANTLNGFHITEGGKGGQVPNRWSGTTCSHVNKEQSKDLFSFIVGLGIVCSLVIGSFFIDTIKFLVGCVWLGTVPFVFFSNTVNC